MVTLPSDEKSLWREAYSDPQYPLLDHTIRVDVAVVGAGITGLTTAYLLKQRGLSVAVIEKDTVGGGTTGRTTGKISSQHELAYTELQKIAGKTSARLYGQANEAAIAWITKTVKKEKIDCEFESADNYVYTTVPSQIQQFKHEAKIAADLGLPATFETTTDLPFSVEAAVKFTNQAKFTSQKYLLGLAKAIDGSESFVFEHSNVTGIREGEPCRVRTGQGEVLARDIVVATSVPTLPLMARGGYCILEYPTESYIVAGHYDGPLKHMYISPDSSHYSILPVRFQGSSYLLIGGGGNLAGMRLGKKRKYEQLAAYGEKYFGITEYTHQWSDRDYMAYDKIPLIGKLYPWSRHLYVGTAYRKWGMTNGTVAGRILSDLITGHKNPWADVFTPQRLRPVKYIPKSVAGQARHLFG